MPTDRDTIDLDRVRADTPGVAHVAHFNNAGAALPPRPVTDAVIAHLRLEAEIGGYEAAARESERTEATYCAIARLLNCASDEIALVENATRAWDMAFYALPFRPGDRILTAEAEYASNVIALLQIARRTGAVIETVPDDGDGVLDVAALEAMIDDRTRLIAVTHVPTNGGLINPAAAIGRVARTAGVPYLLDACQSAGQMVLDVEAIGCDMLTATGRKFLRGPRGTGFLYVRRSLLERLEPPFLDLHSADWVAPDRFEIRPDARRFETWEGHVAGKIGLGVAVDYALDLGLPAIRARVDMLAQRLRAGLTALPGVTVHDKGRDKAGIVSFTVDDLPTDRVKAALAARSINVSASTPSSTLFDMARRDLGPLVRASPHYYNSEAEVDRLIDAVAGLGTG
ncbi:MAG: aminotransferase class V-fold PLP-dependent enzyme [Inquilinaceae bacterium]